jgi:Mce-associated membrane protein
MPPRRRTTSIRRPRVAGSRPALHRAGGPARPSSAVDTVDPGTEHAPHEHEHAGPATEPVGDDDAAATAAGAVVVDDTGEAADGPSPRTGTAAPGARSNRVPLLAAALVVLLAATALFAVLDRSLRGTPAAQNTALVDVGATAEVAGQLGDALETLYSFDFARLEENERAIRDVITPEFGPEFDVIWADVRELAPQLQAVVSATVQVSAVKTIDDDRAELVAFIDQQATRAAAGADAEQLTSAGRITVVGERVEGRWRIAAIEIR